MRFFTKNEWETEMEKFRFAGTLKEIEETKSKTQLLFVPDREYVSSFKSATDATSTYAVLQPADKSQLGYVFEFNKVVKLEREAKPVSMVVGTHYALLLTPEVGTGIIDVTFLDIQDATRNKYAIASIRVP